VPELPEVETIRRQLHERCTGRVLTSLEASWPKTIVERHGDESSVIGREILAVERRGKVLLVQLSDALTLLIHLRMTGQLLIDENRVLEGPLTRAVIGLSRGQLVFNDQRKFGRIVVTATSAVDDDGLLKRLGPEPLSTAFTRRTVTDRLTRHRTASIKVALLDQSTVAGLGNIYVDEVLFVARVHPTTPCAGLGQRELHRIVDAIPEVIATAIARGGSTLRDYRDAGGSVGTYLDEAKVFGRTGQPCRRCDTPIIKIRVGGRGTHLCPRCQKRR
jgi:formamidopyrimidine-DNA glycosylase